MRFASDLNEDGPCMEETKWKTRLPSVKQSRKVMLQLFGSSFTPITNVISFLIRMITFFVARRGYRAVGMCSVARYYSAFSCSDTGVYEDFYIEPVFRGRGIARKLAKAAQTWCGEGISSLTVCCAPCDEKMYQTLGFDIGLGTTFARVMV